MQGRWLKLAVLFRDHKEQNEIWEGKPVVNF